MLEQPARSPVSPSAPAPAGDVVSGAALAALAQQGYFMHDGWLGEPLAHATHEAAARLATEGGLRPAAISRGGLRRVEDRTRGDHITWLEPDAPGPLGPLVAAFESLRLALNRTAFLGLRSFEVQVACYPGDGARYTRHLDAFPGDDNRRVTAILYLNPAWRPEHGGALALHVAPDPVIVPPTLDRLLVFLSEEVAHEVLPSHAPRYAATAWYRVDR